MIIEFSVSNFGSIKDKQTLSFEATKDKTLEDYYVINAPLKTKKGAKAKSIRLLKLGLLYGANGSGKSTIIKAINFMRRLVTRPLETKSDEFDYKIYGFEPYIFDDKTPNQSSFINLSFIHKEIRFDYEVEFTKEYIVSEQLSHNNPNKATVFKRTSNLENQLSEIQFGKNIILDKNDISVLTKNTLYNNSVLAGFEKSNIECEALSFVMGFFRNNLIKAITPKTNLLDFISSSIENNEIDKKLVVDLLQNADFNITDLEIYGAQLNGFYIKIIEKLSADNAPKELIEERLEHFLKQKPTKKLSFLHEVNKNIYSLDYEKESIGTQRYYQLAGILAILCKSSKLLFIDEIESSLHPDLLEHFILSYLKNSKDSQLFLTTHNRDLLNNRDMFRNDAIWFVDKKNDCATELYCLADFPSDTIRKTSSIYNAYKIGRLGATPNID